LVILNNFKGNKYICYTGGQVFKYFRELYGTNYFNYTKKTDR